MRVEGVGTLVRWVLLCALALGVLGMHHLSAPTHGHDSSGGHAAVAAAPQPVDTHVELVAEPQRHCCPGPAETMPPASGQGGGHDSGHDLLAHLCLAVLVAAAGIGLLLVLLRRVPHGRVRPARVTVSGSGHPRPPPPPTSIRLASLCVLRL